MFEYKTPKMDQLANIKSFANASGGSFGFTKALQLLVLINNRDFSGCSGLTTADWFHSLNKTHQPPVMSLLGWTTSSQLRAINLDLKIHLNSHPPLPPFGFQLFWGSMNSQWVKHSLYFQRTDRSYRFLQNDWLESLLSDFSWRFSARMYSCYCNWTLVLYMMGWSH